MLPARIDRDQRQRQGLSRYDSDFDLLAPFIPASPWQMMRRMQEDMDRLFEQFVGQGGRVMASPAGQGIQAWAPHVDVSETEQEYHIEADLPGVRPEDIDIQVQEGQLYLRARMQQGEPQQETQTPNGQTQEQAQGETRSKDGHTPRNDGQESAQAGQTGETPRRYHHRERRFGYFERVMTLPSNVDENNIKADFQHGVLTLRLPKQSQPAPQARRIPIGGESAAMGTTTSKEQSAISSQPISSQTGEQERATAGAGAGAATTQSR